MLINKIEIWKKIEEMLEKEEISFFYEEEVLVIPFHYDASSKEPNFCVDLTLEEREEDIFLCFSLNSLIQEEKILSPFERLLIWNQALEEYVPYGVASLLDPATSFHLSLSYSLPVAQLTSSLLSKVIYSYAEKYMQLKDKIAFYVEAIRHEVKEECSPQ